MRATLFFLACIGLVAVGVVGRAQLPTQVVAANVYAVCPDSNTAFRGIVGGDTVRFHWAQHLQNTTKGQPFTLPPVQWLTTPALAGLLDQQGNYVAKHPAWPVVVQARQGPMVILFCVHNFPR